MFNRKRTGIILCIIGCIIAITACGKNGSICGEWECQVPVSVLGTDAPSGDDMTTLYYYFGEDKTGYMGTVNPYLNDGQDEKEHSEAFTYEISGSSLTLIFNPRWREYYEYKLSGDSLIMTGNSGREYHLERVKSD